ncbi:MAG: DUF4381 domain-containing protein [Pseudomonadales bacterium]|nr:DUF4381 domain-containing protein [Pseudomonadales bacterium]
MNEPMNPLDQLPAVALPEAISAWPATAAWWLLIAMSLLILIALISYCVYRYKAKALKRAALTEAQHLYQQYLLDQDSHRYLTQHNQLLRRFCLQQFPDTACAALSGDAWLQQLDILANKTLYQSECGRQLLDIYQPQLSEDIDIAGLNTLLNNWFKALKIYGKRGESIPS